MQDKGQNPATKDIKIYAISYDPEDALKDFGDRFGIEYDLLSDFDSAVIEKFGILNTLIDPGDRAMHPSTRRTFYGVPFPGVYVVDESGVVTEKFFERHYATRASAGSILNSALGKVLIPADAPRRDFGDERVKVTAFLADEALKLEYRSTLYVRFKVAEGLHIYGDPLPEGFIATRVETDDTHGLRLGEPVYPPTTPRRFEALGETLNVYEGDVDIAIPVIVNAEVLNWTIRDKPESIDIPLKVYYQACSETECFLPKEEELTVTVPLKALIMPGAKSRP